MEGLIKLFNEILNLKDGGATTLGMIITIFFICIINTEFKEKKIKTFYSFCIFITKFIIALIPSLSFSIWQENFDNVTIGTNALISIYFTGFLLFGMYPWLETKYHFIIKKFKLSSFDFVLKTNLVYFITMIVISFFMSIPDMMIIEIVEIQINLNYIIEIFFLATQYLFWFCVIQIFLFLQWKSLNFKQVYFRNLTLINFVLSIYFFENIYYLLIHLILVIVFSIYKYATETREKKDTKEKDDKIKNNSFLLNSQLLNQNQSTAIKIQRNIIRNGKNSFKYKRRH